MTTPVERSRHRLDGAPCYHAYYHGLSCEDFEALCARADGHCELCGIAQDETPRGYLVTDHFEAGRFSFVRGLVCDACNAVMSCIDGNKVWGANRRWEERAREYERNSWQPPHEEALALMAGRTEMISKFDPRYQPPKYEPCYLEQARPGRASTIQVPLDRGPAALARVLQRHLTSKQVARLAELLSQEG